MRKITVYLNHDNINFEVNEAEYQKILMASTDEWIQGKELRGTLTFRCSDIAHIWIEEEKPDVKGGVVTPISPEVKRKEEEKAVDYSLPHIIDEAKKTNE